ncbi:MAG: N-acetyltransferase [Chloroflexi bacterium]|nr:N-acetyltransferase [Chloroflexota bacterium]
MAAEEHSSTQVTADIVVRPGNEADLARINEIYNHYVVNTPITFDIEPISMPQRRQWFERYATSGRYRLLVAEAGGALIGYAYSHQYHARQAYDTTVEVSVYCAPEATGRGVGTRLYTALFEAIQGEDLRTALAGVTLPNEASVALHERFGFSLSGVQHDVGRKFGRYWDVAWYEKRLD